MKIALGCDHAGYEYKELIKVHLTQQDNMRLEDFGAYTEESVDYPDFAHAVGKAISQGDADMGVLVCGSANGVAMTANKHEGVRCAIVWSEEITKLARLHNDANVIAIPARFLSSAQAMTYVQTFLATPFEGGRHSRRVDKISCS